MLNDLCVESVLIFSSWLTELFSKQTRESLQTSSDIPIFIERKTGSIFKVVRMIFC